MDNFVVSARKYRPTTFDSVVGQSHITTTLKNAIKNNHLAQAFLFCGPRGVGKTTNARILAKTINCENITADIEACNECESCKSFNNNASFNVHELDAASNNSVDDIRNLVDQVRYPPQYGKYKIYIIDEVHMLSNAAFNAFLKTLEEPPSYAIFILATTEKHKIIPTILSRCQIFDFNRIQVKDISDHLARIAEKENIKAEPQALHLIAQKADGALRDALSIFDLIVTFSSNNSVTYKTTIDNLHILDYDYYFKMTDFLNNQDMPNTLLTLDEIYRAGFDGHNFIIGLAEHFRNLLVCKDPATVKLLEVAEEIQKKYLAQASSASLSFLMSALNIANQCDLNYKSSKNQRLLVEMSLMKMAFVNSAINVAREGIPQGDIKKKTELANSDSSEKKEVVAEKKNEVTQPVSSGTKTDISSKFNIPDLNALKNKPIEKKEIVKKEEEVTPVTSVNKPFTEVQLKRYWDEYALILRNNGKLNESTILEQPFQMKEDGQVVIKVKGRVQADQFNTFKVDFLTFLRKNLENQTIHFDIDMEEIESKKIIYTSQDKLKFLSEKHPILNDLRNRLGLEPDF